jgi:sugar phosphate isomerase/epimerase
MAGTVFPSSGFAENTGTSKKKNMSGREICVFSKHLQWLDYDAMAGTAAEIGFDGIDLTVRPGGHVVPEKAADDLPRAVEAVRKNGLDVYMMTTAVVDPGGPYTEPILKTAHQLGIQYYRTGYLDYDVSLGIAESLQSYKPMLRDLAEMNKEYGIHGAYQNHAGTRVGGPVWDVWFLIKDLDPRWIGCQYDVRHATLEGGYCWSLGLRLLAPFVKTTVIKDFKWVEAHGTWEDQSVPFGEGMVNFKEYFEIIRELNISGPISVHYEYPIEPSESTLSSAERRKLTMSVMRNDLLRLRSMLRDAGLSES